MDINVNKRKAELFTEGFNDGLTGLPRVKDDPDYINGYREGHLIYKKES